MIFEKKLMPELMTAHYYDITPELLKSMNIYALFCDVDNTLLTYDEEEPTEKLTEWIGELDKSGIKVAFVSNNDRKRLEIMNSSLGKNIYPKAGKPKPDILTKAISDSQTAAEKCAFLGDQLLTDCACAHLAGIRCIIVPPIKDRRGWFFRLKRYLERPYVKKYCALNNIKRGFCREWDV